MEKSCPSTAAAPDSTTTSSINRQSTDHFLKQLNKSSHKISKHPHQSHQHHHLGHPKQPSHASQPSHHNNNPQQHQQQNQQQQQQQQQPPVYNINKNDFRDVVQKLTGSPAHDRFSTPPPIHPPKPPSSRLQRIRPPPLAQISTRPPPCAPPTLFTDNNLNSNSSSNNYNYNNYNNNNNNNNSGIFIGRPRSPFSPLPPFPTVSATAESPISAYMKYLQGSMSYVDPGRAPGFSPRWNPNVTSSFQQALFPSPTANSPPSQLLPPQFLLPTSPMAFGHIPLSPRSPYPLLSPSLLFSPSAQLGFPPVSPRLPVPSPRWRDL